MSRSVDLARTPPDTRPPPQRRSSRAAYRLARSRANRRIWWLAHALVWAITCFLIFVVSSFFVAFVVALAWGIGLASHGFWAIVAPELRQRWIDEEVGHRVHVHVSDERRALTGAHSKNLERLSASIAHEIRNPITAAKSLVQQMGEDPASEENVEYARVALEELDRVESSITHLLRYAREEEVKTTEVSIADVVDSALDTLSSRIEKDSVHVERDVSEAGAVLGDADKLRRVVLNLLTNALDAMRDAGTADPRIDVTAGRNLAGTEAWIRVADRGPGIPAEHASEIFDPFFTSKRDGTGLGLPISKKLVEAHGGTLEPIPSSDGAEMLVTLPAAGTGADAS